MKSNLNNKIPRDSELTVKAQKFLDAAHEYWKEHQKHIGTCSVVWVEGSDGKFALFTNGEYRDSIMMSVEKINDDALKPLTFEDKIDGLWY